MRTISVRAIIITLSQLNNFIMISVGFQQEFYSFLVEIWTAMRVLMFCVEPSSTKMQMTALLLIKFVGIAIYLLTLWIQQLWDAAILFNRIKIVQAMVDAAEKRTIALFVLKKAAYYNRPEMFRLFIEHLDPTASELRIALKTASFRGFVEILRTAWECGVPHDVTVWRMTSWLKDIRQPDYSQSHELQKYYAVLDFALEHSLVDQSVFLSIIPQGWDCAKCAQIVNLCTDQLGFDPEGCSMVGAVGGRRENSLWWTYNPARTWDLRDSPKQSLVNLISVISQHVLYAKNEQAKLSMWDIAEEIMALDCRVVVPPSKTSITYRYRVEKDVAPVHHFSLDGNLRLLLYSRACLQQASCSGERSNLLNGCLESAEGHELGVVQEWLRLLDAHPAVQVALACQHQSRGDEDLTFMFKQILETLSNADFKFGPCIQGFDRLCGHILLWLLRLDSTDNKAEQFLHALKQTVPALPSLEATDDPSVVGTLLCGRSECIGQHPELSHVIFFERHIERLSWSHYQQFFLTATSFDSNFYRLLQHPHIDLSILDYFVSEERTKDEATARIPTETLHEVMILVLEQTDPADDIESRYAMEQVNWMVEYIMRIYKVGELQKIITTDRAVSIVQSGHVHAVRLLQDHGALYSPQQKSAERLFIAACEIGSKPIAEVIAEAVYEREGAQGWLSLFDRHSAVYTAEVAAEINGHVHLQHWLRDLQQRATEIISSSFTDQVN